MKEYKFQSVDNISYALINIGIFTSPMFICPIIVLLKVSSNQLLSIFLSFSVLILGLIFYKRLIQIKEQRTEIDDEGFGYLNQKKHSWDTVKWYRIDNNKADTIETIVIALKNAKKVRFTFYKKTKDENDWEIFKSEFVRMIDLHCPVLAAWCDSKAWNVFIMSMVMIEILTLIVWLVFKLDWSIVTPILLGLSFGIMVFSLMVYSERRRIAKRNKLILKNLSDRISK